MSMNPPPRRFLIVEDEVLIGLVLEDILDLVGCEVAANCADFAEAEAAVGQGGFDAAILDVHVGGRPIFPLADRLRESGTPLIFATGSTREALPERFRDVPLLEKPYALPAVEAAVGRVFD
jgi:DNA-binding response OmpR family regulator